MKYVVMYESADDVMTKAPLYLNEHRERWQEYLRDGTLLAIGPFADPREGSMGVFRTREAAEQFVAGDPFVLNGVVKNWSIREWNEVLL